MNITCHPKGMPEKPADISAEQHSQHIVAYCLMQNIGVSGSDRETAARVLNILQQTGCSHRINEILGTEWYNTGAVDIDVETRNQPLTASELLAIHTPPKTFAARIRGEKPCHTGRMQ